ncbi:MAG: HAMP domain-containing sensor histidine kinase [Anaerolineales bacterium]|jgi:signal transduction histidine kinase
MFTSLRSRLWISYAVLIGVVLVVVFGALVVYAARSNLLSRVELTNVANRIAERQNVPIPQRADLEGMAARLDENLGFRILVLDPQWVTLADSRASTEGALPPLSPPERDHLARVSVITDSDGEDWLYITRRTQGNFIIAVATPRQPLREVMASPVLRELAGDILWAGAIALLLALLLAYLISRWVAAPLQKMSGAAVAVAEGRRTQVKLSGPDEVRALGEAFNQMTQRVHASQESQRDFVANVSHELKTPLTSIQGFAQAILDGTASAPDALKRAAQVIYDESGRMHRLVLDLLDLARLDAGTADLERAPLDLAQLLRAVAERFTPQSQEAQVYLSTEIGELPSFIGDGDRLSQVFTNLVDNALKHTPQGGQVAIRAHRNGEWVQVSVADTGPGIPPEELTRIFERFYQLDKARKGGAGRGVGLGLSIARQIIQAHNGTLSAQSKAGEGSVFIVSLPAVQSGDTTMVSPRNPSSR